MNKTGQAHLHGHYTGNIPVIIWVLIIAIACIGVGLLVPGLGTLAFIGAVLLVLGIGGIVIAILSEFA